MFFGNRIKYFKSRKNFRIEFCTINEGKTLKITKYTRLNIPMSNAPIVKKFESICNIARHKRGFLFSKAHLALNVIEKRAASHFLENHVETTVVFKPFNQLD